MKRLLNGLLCHNVIIVLLLFVLAGWFFRHQIFTLPTPAEPAEPAFDNQPVKVEPAVTSAPAVIQQTQPVSVEPELAPSGSPEPEQESAVSVDLSVNNASNNAATAPDVASNPAMTQSAIVEPPVSAATSTAVAETFPESAKHNPEKIAAEQDYQFRPDSVVVDENIAETDLLQKARQAYWNDQLDKAESLYRAYIELNPDNPDGYGELGNLLSTVGSLGEAAIMYQQAAELLLRQGRIEQAAKLREVLDSIEIIQKRKN